VKAAANILHELNRGVAVQLLVHDAAIIRIARRYQQNQFFSHAVKYKKRAAKDISPAE
jgi:hypothetical protein